jgi:hypothetical protein
MFSQILLNRENKMRAYAKIFFSILALFFIALAGCAKSPVVIDRWMDEAYTGKKFGKILVIGKADTITGRSLFEGKVARKLQSRGVEVVRSYTILPDDEMLTREIILAAIQESNIDSVLFTYVADRSNKKVYYQNAHTYTYYNYYNNVMNVGNVGATSSYDIEVLSLITNFYDVKSEDLVWSMIYDFEFMYKAKSLDSATTLVVEKLLEDGLI